MHHLKRPVAGLTILELMTVLVIICILALILLPVVAGVREKAQRGGCVTNLKSLHVATSGYLQDHGGTWPQISPSLASKDHPSYAEQWQAALARYSVPPKVWVCPAIQSKLGNPNLENPRENKRVDYIACPFDDKPGTAFRWPRQPWFLEKSDVHGAGNLILFPDGTVMDMKQVLLR